MNATERFLSLYTSDTHSGGTTSLHTNQCSIRLKKECYNSGSFVSSHMHIKYDIRAISCSKPTVEKQQITSKVKQVIVSLGSGMNAVGI